MIQPAAQIDGDASKRRLRFWLQLLKATKHVENDIRDRLRREFDTTLPRFDVMAMLHKSGIGLKMSELSAELMVSNGNVTGIIDRLVSDGLVVRVSIKGDRRATLVRLTPRGAVEFADMARVHEGWVSELLAELDDIEISQAIETLAKVRELT
jgi:DNA-binding MarR family transcriptional regulator